MPQLIKEQSTLANAFQETRARREPLWLTRLREEAFERFEDKGFPSIDDEDWKYTNVGAIARGDFGLASEQWASALAAEEVEAFTAPESSASRIVFVNGIFRREWSSLDALPVGVVAVDIASALSGEHEAMVRERLESSARRGEDNLFVSLNTAFLAGGAFIVIPRGVTVETPIELLFLSNAGGEPFMSAPRLVVVAEHEASATLIESYAATTTDANYLTNAFVDVSVGDGARLTHYKTQRESERAFHVAMTRAELGRDSFYDLTSITLGAAISRHGIEIVFDQAGAECHADGLYIVGDGQHADTHSLIDHRQPHCASRQLYKGILDGKSRAVFNGKVFVQRDAQQTDAQQTNKNLLLSNEARVDTKPQLEIFADDVKCAHGATVGQLEEEQLFYLRSRGLHTELARNLLTFGFAEELVEKIKIDSIKSQLNEAILNRLHARLEP